MRKFIMLIFLIIILCVVWALPLYLAVNFVCWVFHIGFRLSLLQAVAVSLLATIIHKLFFKKGGND